MARAEQTVLNYALVGIDFPPYQFVVEGKPTGPDADLVAEIIRRMQNYRIDHVITPTGRVLAEARSGELDIGGAFPTREALKVSLLTKHPLHVSDYRLYSLDRSGKINNIKDLDGLTIGLVLGHTLNPQFKRFFAGHNVTLKQVLSFESQIMMLRSGRVDAIVSNSNVVNFYTLKWAMQDSLQKSEIKIVDPVPFYFGISKASRKVDPTEFIKQADTVMEAMRKDGTWLRILRKYYGEEARLD